LCWEVNNAVDIIEIININPDSNELSIKAINSGLTHITVVAGNIAQTVTVRVE